jgi:hypothetical protein
MMSVIAIIISIGVPLCSHYFGNPYELAKKYSPMLEYDENEIYDCQGFRYTVMVYNMGKTPAKSIRVYIWSRDEFVWLPSAISVETEPPSPTEFSVREKNKRVLVEIQRALGAGERLSLTVPNIQSPVIGYSGMRCQVYYEEGAAKLCYAWMTVSEDAFDF